MEDRNQNEELRRKGMENSTEGKMDELKGRAKDAVGGMTDDSSMQAEGKWDKAKGKAKDALGGMQQDTADENRRR